MAKKRHCLPGAREPRQRKGESWKDYCVRQNAWSDVRWPKEEVERQKAAFLESERIRAEQRQRYLEIYRPEAIEELKRSERAGAVFFWFGAAIDDKYNDAGNWALSLAGYITQPQLDYLMHKWYGIPLPPPRRPEDHCLQHEDHQCFMPEGPAHDVQVRWLLPLSPWYFPVRDLQPAYIQREYSKHFCCPEAAFLFARKQEQEGCEAVRLVKGWKKDGETETVSEFAPRFYGDKPCWYS